MNKFFAKIREPNKMFSNREMIYILDFEILCVNSMLIVFLHDVKNQSKMTND